MKTKAIIFDVDGVLIRGKGDDGQYLWKQSIEKDLGISVQQVQSFFKNYWGKIGAGELDTLVVLEEFLKSINSDVKPTEFINYWHRNDSHINEPILNLVKKLKNTGFDLYLGTNQEKYRAGHLWENLDFKSYFKKMFASFELGHEKPDLSFYKSIESQIDLKPEQILFIDDTKKHIDVAKSIGWQAIHHRDNDETLKYFTDQLL